MYKEDYIKERLIRDVYYVKSKRTEDFVDKNGLVLPTFFNKTDKNVCTQSGNIVMIPTRHTDMTPIEVSLGDKVYFHHFVTTEVDNETYYKDIFKCRFDELICKVVDGEIIMLNQWCLIEPENPKEVSKNGLIYEQKKENIGTVRYADKRFLEGGGAIGDRVMFGKDMDYDIIIEGKTYYRVSSAYILGTFVE